MREMVWEEEKQSDEWKMTKSKREKKRERERKNKEGEWVNEEWERGCESDRKGGGREREWKKIREEASGWMTVGTRKRNTCWSSKVQMSTIKYNSKYINKLIFYLLYSLIPP